MEVGHSQNWKSIRLTLGREREKEVGNKMCCKLGQCRKYFGLLLKINFLFVSSLNISGHNKKGTIVYSLTS